MEILAIIPVRGGSKGIPLKNIKPLAGRPLLEYSIEAAQNSRYVTRTIVSTEDKRIKDAALACGAEVLDRPDVLAQDETKTAPVLLHVVEELEKQGYKPDVVVLLQATCPLRDARELDEAFELFFENEKNGCDSVFAARKAGLTHALWREIPPCYENPKQLKGTPKDCEGSSFECLYDYRNRPRRQDTDKHYPMLCETGATYIVKTDVMKEVKDFIGRNPKVYTEGSSIDIDTEDDFERAAQIIEKRRENTENYEKKD